ncbi:MAG: toll/interleukin-1 receptor domain-containing protein [Magnetococcales bacterium]|nr:toll/interleukin-1 receptor domain-containing protein [Magnetococcales bacterium]
MPNAKVFISYSHADAKILKTFLPYATSLENDGTATVWHDGKLKEGQDWESEINQAIRETNVAVLFISQTFLTSAFIWEKELPPLVDAWEKKTLTIFPVFVRPSDAKERSLPFTHPETGKTKTLTTLQGFATPQRTLAMMKVVEREQVFLELSQRIRELTQDTPLNLCVSYSNWALAKFGKVSLLGVEGGRYFIGFGAGLYPSTHLATGLWRRS